MRIVWFLGWMAMISTASAQPAPPDAPPDSIPPVEAVPTLSPPSMTAPVSAGPGAAAPASEEAEPERESYGWQIAIADAAGAMLLFGHNQSSASAGVLVYALGGPIIHVAHEQGGRAVASLALRLGLPVASAWAWNAYAQSGCSPKDDDCDTTGAVAVGLILGFVTAMVIDATALSHPVKVKKPARLTWVPQVAATRQQVGLGVLGQF